ncbi:MAG: ZIP family metal transporter, partial [Deltaproteobacteria bacterium]|nr:ZIP family metal transporter [Deltaproteobacteria bacterium]
MGIEFTIMFSSIIAGFATIVGVILVIMNAKWVVKHSHFVNSFAAGLILAITFFHLLPEALKLTEDAVLFLFMGFLIFYLLENVVVLHSGSEVHFSEKADPRHAKGVVMFTGLFIHSLLDGVIIGIGFELDPRLGWLTAFGVISHELPEGVTTFSLLINSIKRKAAVYLSLAVALATPLGALVSLTFIGSLSETVIGAMLALAGGSFLYISASDLIPETHEEKGLHNAGF